MFWKLIPSSGELNFNLPEGGNNFTIHCVVLYIGNGKSPNKY
jgi:hypothetical protein